MARKSRVITENEKKETVKVFVWKIGIYIRLSKEDLRNNDEWKEKVIYFGPMGCRTGCYLILAGDYESKDVVGLVRDTFSFIADYEGEIPGAAARDCGNYLDQNLPMAKYLAKKYLNEALNNPSEKNLIYPA